MPPSRDDELVRRRIDVDGGRDPTDGTILSLASPWHSNVASGETGGFPVTPSHPRDAASGRSSPNFRVVRPTGNIDEAFSAHFNGTLGSNGSSCIKGWVLLYISSGQKFGRFVEPESLLKARIYYMFDNQSIFLGRL